MTIKYHDVSHYNGAYVPTGPTCAKATEGSTFVDPQYDGIRRRTLAGGWAFLPYHFLHHGNIDAQVDHTFSVVGHQPLMLDVESEKDTPDSTLADVYAFADRWKAVTGQLVTLAYIPHWYWSGHWGSPSLAGLKSRGIGLVSSNYTTYSDTGPGWAGYGGITPVIWQYTSTPIDTNAFKGTTAELANLWANGTATKPSAPVEDELSAAEVTEIKDAIAGSAKSLFHIPQFDPVSGKYTDSLSAVTDKLQANDAKIESAVTALAASVEKLASAVACCGVTHVAG